MKLSDLKSILQFDTDFADNEIDATFYTEIDDILPKYAKNLNVLAISTNYITCDFTNFINHHKTAIREYLYKEYYIAWASYYFTGIFDDQDAECIAYFIEHDMDDFLRGEY